MQGKPGKGKSSACSSSIQAEADGTTGPSTVQGEAHTDAQPYVRQMAAPGPANPHARGGRWVWPGRASDEARNTGSTCPG